MNTERWAIYAGFNQFVMTAIFRHISETTRDVTKAMQFKTETDAIEYLKKNQLDNELIGCKLSVKKLDLVN